MVVYLIEKHPIYSYSLSLAITCVIFVSLKNVSALGKLGETIQSISIIEIVTLTIIVRPNQENFNNLALFQLILLPNSLLGIIYNSACPVVMTA